MESCLETLWLVTSGNGPEECAYAAALTLRCIAQEVDALAAAGADIAFRLVETEASGVSGNIKSALFALSGADAESFITSWAGTVQWIWQSAYRPHHRRKNWFVAVKAYQPPEDRVALSIDEVRFESARSSGPGGQSVNKTESAVRAVHIASGISALSRDERSQSLNKKTAFDRLAARMAEEAQARELSARSGLRHTHYETERGNPVRVFDAETLQRKDGGKDANHGQG
jgi:peptide chain release factor